MESETAPSNESIFWLKALDLLLWVKVPLVPALALASIVAGTNPILTYALGKPDREKTPVAFTHWFQSQPPSEFLPH